MNDCKICIGIGCMYCRDKEESKNESEKLRENKEANNDRVLGDDTSHSDLRSA